MFGGLVEFPVMFRMIIGSSWGQGAQLSLASISGNFSNGVGPTLDTSMNPLLLVSLISVFSIKLQKKLKFFFLSMTVLFFM